MTVHLTFDDLAAVADAAVGPAWAYRDAGLLQSALARPQATVLGRDGYPTICLKAAALMQSLARNHGLVDGNKRLAWTSTILFLALNDVDVAAATVNDGERFVLAVITGEIDVPDIAQTLYAWSLRYPTRMSRPADGDTAN